MKGITESKDTLGPGDLRLITAELDLIHPGMPRIDIEKDEHVSIVKCLQLWIDFFAGLKGLKLKDRDPRANKVPVVAPSNKFTVKVISDQSYGG